MDKKRLVDKKELIEKEKRQEQFKWWMLGDIEEGKDGKKCLYPKIYHSTSATVRFNIKKDSVFLKTRISVQNELKKIPGQPYKLQLSPEFHKLRNYKNEFDDARKPSMPIKAFVEAYDAGIYPPLWVLNYVVEKFREFDKSLGEKSLDGLFGFARGKWKPSFKEKFLEETRDELLCKDMYRMKVLFKMSPEHSSQIVATLLDKDATYGGSGYRFRIVTSETIKDKYFKKYSRKYSKDRALNSHIHWWEPAEIAKFMSKFSKDDIEAFVNDYPILKAYLK